MLRSILAVIGGYAAMFVCTMILFTAYYFLIGVEAAYQPGSYEVTGLWIAGSIVIGVITAIIGGYTCAVIARQSTPVKVLAGIVFVLGIASAIMYVPEGLGQVREGAVSITDAMSYSIEPRWLSFLWPVIGAVFTLYGGTRALGSRPDGGEEPVEAAEPVVAMPPADSSSNSE